MSKTGDGLATVVLLVWSLAFAGSTVAADAPVWPSRALRIIVPLPAGTGVDAMVRHVASGLAARLKQPVIVENRTGAGGNIGMEAVAKSPPDGYMLLAAATSLVTNPHLYPLNYDPVRDFAPVTQILGTYFVLAAHPSLPATTVRELFALAKARPGEVTCAHASGATHLSCAWLRAAGHADFYLVPYRGVLQAMTDVIGGHADLVFSFSANVMPHAASKRLRVIATTGSRRGVEPFPMAPTIAETLPGFELVSWVGFMVPAGTPREIIERLNGEIAAVAGAADTRKLAAVSGSQLVHGSPEAFSELIRRDYAKFGRIIRETGIRAE